uniref:ADP-ribosylation factor-like protein 2 n=3 Tax=Myzomyia TaxID=59140 RepID=A0A182WK70_9DIPT
MDRWNNKVAVVTGASSGIGAAIAKDLAKAGMITIGLARRVERVEQLKQELPKGAASRLHAMKCDVSVESDIEQTFQRIRDTYGGVDVLVNNAGIVRSNNLLDIGTTADLRAVLDTNVTGLVLCSQWAFKSMVDRKFDGHIVHISSVAGHIVPNIPKLNIYPGTKHAVTAITETMRQEMRAAGTKIKVTSVNPGGVKTEIIDSAAIPEGMPLLEAEDVSAAVLYAIGTPPNVQMGFLTILKKMKQKEKEMRILLLGLDNAGKTTILKRFNGEPIDQISPTLGFNIKTLHYNDYVLNMWDVGGQKSLRSYWRNYFECTDGLIWVVDSTDRMRMESCREELTLLLQEERLAGATLLVLANKQDLPGALTANEIKEILQLDKIETHHWSIQSVSAVTGGKLVEAIDWLVEDISKRIFTLD